MSLTHTVITRLSSLTFASAPLPCLTACLAACLAACNSADPLPVYFDLNYQVGCVLPECTANDDGPERIVMAVDGENGFQNSCASSSMDGAKLVTLSSSNSGQNIRFQISSALFGVDGNVGSNCRVKIEEDNTTFEGRCSSASPTLAIPCQLTEFRATSSGSLEGKLYCNNIPAGNSPSTTRDIAEAGAFDSCLNDSGQAVDPQFCPATFLIDPCDGL